MAPSQHQWDGLGLDRRHRLVAGVDDGAQQLGVERKGIEQRGGGGRGLGRVDHGGVSRADTLSLSGAGRDPSMRIMRGERKRTIRQYTPRR